MIAALNDTIRRTNICLMITQMKSIIKCSFVVFIYFEKWDGFNTVTFIDFCKGSVYFKNLQTGINTSRFTT